MVVATVMVKPTLSRIQGTRNDKRSVNWRDKMERHLRIFEGMHFCRGVHVDVGGHDGEDDIKSPKYTTLENVAAISYFR